MKPGRSQSDSANGILKDALGSMTVSKGRTFKIELPAEREKMSDGDISARRSRRTRTLMALRTTSRAEDNETASSGRTPPPTTRGKPSLSCIAALR